MANTGFISQPGSFNSDTIPLHSYAPMLLRTSPLLRYSSRHDRRTRRLDEALPNAIHHCLLDEFKRRTYHLEIN